MPHSYTEDARKILESMRNMQTMETYVEVSDSSFTHLNLQAYEQVRETLNSHGFRYLADLELLELSQSPNILFKPTMLRTYVSEDGSTIASHYQTRPRLDRLFTLLFRGIANLRLIAAPTFFLQQLPTKNFFDFETEFEDGTFLVTSNASNAGLLSQPPTIDHAFYPSHTPVLEILENHNERLRKRISSGASAIPIRTLEDCHQMQRRLKALKDAHRHTIQWVSQSEMRAMGTNKNQSDGVFAEVQRLLREENEPT